MWNVAAIGLAFILASALIQQRSTSEAKPRQPEPFAAFELGDLLAKRQESERSYLPFLSRKTLSTGIYHLAKGTKDLQKPHAFDEIYYVIRGKSRFEADGKEVAVKPGSILFVAAGIEHRFLAIEEDLTVLVFFSNMKPK